jgi:diguanylate cyclase (GGDEF)-like protein
MHLDAEMSRAKRNTKPRAVLVCDLDSFKQVNDRFGHLSGNKLLSLMAVRMQQTCRDYDYVARMGGDEFVLILPDISMEAARRKMLELDQIAREAGIEVCGEEIVSLSVGVAHYPEDGAGAEDLLAEADRKMYRRKQARAASRQTGQRVTDLVEEVASAG